MEKTKIRIAFQKMLNHFGYSLSKTSRSPFAVQSDLIKVAEPVILDIGAHIGEVAKIYRKRFPLANIYCFEPFPQSFQALSQIVEGQSRTFFYKTAVSDKKGSALLNANLHSATNSLLPTDARGSSFWGPGLLNTTSQVEVCTTTVDLFCHETGISHIDILKMDVQGSEFSVLMGANGMLENQSISLIYTEMIMCPTYEGQHKFHEYISLLDSLGYEFSDFFNPIRQNNQLIQADVLFFSSTFKDEITKRIME